ncbi:altronate dehydratase family protein [Opitutales bacterium]|nr:altronate dehydratase family protein [Opitutales bacterium]
MSFGAMKAIKVSESDNLLVALQNLTTGETIETKGGGITIRNPVSAKHKIAATDIGIGEKAFMYGVLVGEATRPIFKGERITTDNLIHRSSEYHNNQKRENWKAPITPNWEQKSFLGYQRTDGKVGTANYWLVVPMVFCENGNVEVLRRSMTKALGFDQRSQYENFADELAKAYQQGDSPAAVQLPQENTNRPSPIFPNIDGVKFLTHGLGCGETRGVSHELCGLLAGYACNPNVAGITILSLGCQHAQVSIMEEEISKRCANFDKPFLVFEQQKYPSEREMLEKAIRQTFENLAEINKTGRTAAPLSKLCLGMECGASDGFSGISANPCIGQVADLTVGLGGRVILSEFPELCGVEQEIVNRCESREIGDRFIEIMRNYEERVKEAGSGFHMNPSPGNVKDGLITDAIKSAGAARKGGTSPVVDVFDYPGWVKKDGLSLLCTAGNDVESTTAMAGAGANLILFSTGLGTPTGNPISPVIKIASNSPTAKSFKEYIDFDTGSIIDGSESVESLGEKLLDEVIAYASGIKKTKADLQGRDDFLPWKRGMSL